MKKSTKRRVFYILGLILIAGFFILPNFGLSQEVNLKELEKYLLLPEDKLENVLRSLIGVFHSEWVDSMASAFSTAEERAVSTIMKNAVQMQALNYVLIDVPIDAAWKIINNAVKMARFMLTENIAGVIGELEKQTVQKATQSGIDFLLQKEIKAGVGAMTFKYTSQKGNSKEVIFQYIMLYKSKSQTKGEVLIRFYSPNYLEPPQSRGSIGGSRGLYTDLDHDLPPFIVDIQGEMENYQWVGRPRMKIDFPEEGVPDLGIQPLDFWEKHIFQPIEVALKEVEIIVGRILGVENMSQIVSGVEDIIKGVKGIFSRSNSSEPDSVAQLPSETTETISEIEKSIETIQKEIVKEGSVNKASETSKTSTNQSKTAPTDNLDELQKVLDELARKIADLSQEMNEFAKEKGVEFLSKESEEKLALEEDLNERERERERDCGQNSININTASLKDLEKLIGIGPVLAQRIIDARPFSLLNDLLEVKGIGEVTLQKIIAQGCAFVSGSYLAADNRNSSSTNVNSKNSGGSSSSPVPISYPKILISEVQIEGNNVNQDFIELYNPNNSPVDMSGYKLRKRTSSGKEYSIHVFPSGSNIWAKGYYLWASSTDENYPSSINADSSTKQTLAVDNSIALFDPSDNIIDAVAWGVNLQNPFFEKSPFNKNPGKFQSIERKKDALGNYIDNNDNLNDFQLQNCPNPKGKIVSCYSPVTPTNNLGSSSVNNEGKDTGGGTVSQEEENKTKSCLPNSIDINTASLEDLEKLIGIGPVLAQRIIDARPFSLLNDLLEVKGIGEVTLQKIIAQGCAYVLFFPAKLEVSPEILEFSIDSPPKYLSITNSGGETLNWRANIQYVTPATDGWLSIFPTSGQLKAKETDEIEVSQYLPGLPSGEYQAEIIIIDADKIEGSSKRVEILLKASDNTPPIVSFNPLSPTQSESIFTLSWQGEDVLPVSPVQDGISFVSPSDIDGFLLIYTSIPASPILEGVTSSVNGLKYFDLDFNCWRDWFEEKILLVKDNFLKLLGKDRWTYFFQIKAKDKAGNLSENWVPEPPLSTKIELLPELKISSSDFKFKGREEGADLPPQILTLQNIGLGDLNWEIIEDIPWLSLSQQSGELLAGQSSEIEIIVNIAGLREGSYSDFFRIDGFDIEREMAFGSLKQIIVNLDILPKVSPPKIIWPESKAIFYALDDDSDFQILIKGESDPLYYIFDENSSLQTQADQNGNWQIPAVLKEGENAFNFRARAGDELAGESDSTPLFLYLKFVIGSDLDKDGLIDAYDPETVISAGETISLAAGEYYFKDLILEPNAKLILESNPALEGFKGVKINADNIKIDFQAVISADGKGFAADGPGAGEKEKDWVRDGRPGGGGYGGKGGDGNGGNYGGKGGKGYGSLFQPTDLGSGGGNGSKRGGGAIWLEVNNQLLLEGVISANGENGGNTGAGSGGSIWITTNSLIGSGSISANGGNEYWGGAGGGGRIAIDYIKDLCFNIDNILAKGGKSFSSEDAGYYGGAGTIYLKSASQEYGDLIIKGSKGVSRFLETNLQFDNLKVLDSVHLYLPESLTLNNFQAKENSILEAETSSTINVAEQFILSESVELKAPPLFIIKINAGNLELRSNASFKANVNIEAANLLLDSSSLISADGKGFAADGLGAGEKEKDWSRDGRPGGGGYGGKGGDGNNESYGGKGGKTYGNEAEPIDFGSGGGGGSTRGGGVVRINLNNNLTLDGKISANGTENYNAGAGSGGSIWITANSLTGSGSISANGGNDLFGGAGGGGRIAIYSKENFVGNIESRAGSGNTATQNGEIGTILFIKE